MNTTYIQKSFAVRKVANTNTESVKDSSIQNDSLQRKADMANGTAQRAADPRPNNTGLPDNLKTGIESLSGFSMDDVRVHYNSSKPATLQIMNVAERNVQFAMNSGMSSAQPIQRRIRYADLIDYANAYGPEIRQTDSLNALIKLVQNNPTPGFSPLHFTDRYRDCKVGVTGGAAPKDVQNINLPDPEAPVDKSCENVKNLSKKLKPKHIKRMFAIHELEHLRLFYKNSNGNLNQMNVDAGEPSMNTNIMSMFVPLKRNICDSLREVIPKKLNANLKAYIEERLMYIMKPKNLRTAENAPENSTARELTTVLLELKKFCEFCDDKRLRTFYSRVCRYYNTWSA